MKLTQGAVISVNEVWNNSFNYPEIITNLNFVMIQTILLETINGKSLKNPDNTTSNNLTQYNANVTNNPENEVICLNELRQ